MTRRIADLFALRRASLLTRDQLVTGLARVGVAEPERLADDPSIPDPSSAGFAARVAPYLRSAA